MAEGSVAGSSGARAGAAPAPVRIGTADVRLPRALRDRFPEGDSLLARYAGGFHAVEVNRTFYTLPRASTFARWADTVPSDFRFSIKLPREITHVRRLRDPAEPLARLLEATLPLGDRRGPLLVQLPPSLQLDPAAADDFLGTLRSFFPGPDALEPRHPSWFTPEATALLERWRIARVAADPPRAEGDGFPAGDPALAYFRLHGTPRVYYSEYGDDALRQWADRIQRARATASEVWCIFDNTALDAAPANALEMKELVR